MKKKLQEAKKACDELIELMQSPHESVREKATDAARGLLWKWVDEGNATELINLLAAIRLLVETTLEHQEYPDE